MSHFRPPIAGTPRCETSSFQRVCLGSRARRPTAHPQEGNRHTRRRLHANSGNCKRHRHSTARSRGSPLRSARMFPRLRLPILVSTAEYRFEPPGQACSRHSHRLRPPLRPASPTDLSMGWHGTLWGIDAQGALHVYDAINDVWTQHNRGIDAAAATYDNRDAAYVFMGSQMVMSRGRRSGARPGRSGPLGPDLPDSFKLGVTGATGLLQSPSELMLFLIRRPGMLPPATPHGSES